MPTYFDAFDDLPSRDVYRMQLEAIRRGERKRRTARLVRVAAFVSVLISATVAALAIAAFL